MGVYNYDSASGNLTAVATSGQRIWVGTTAQYQSAKQAGTLPNNCIINITDDESDCWADGIKFDKTVSKLNADNTQEAIDALAVYSTTETIVGKWIDEKPIYRKVINFGSLPDISQKAVAHGITNLENIINISGYAKSSGGSTFLTIPYDYRTTGIDQNVNIYADTSNVVARTNWSCSQYSAVIILEYTKTTD